MRRQFFHKYEDVISLDNLFSAWREFLCGKRGKEDVRTFSIHVIDNIISLHEALLNKTYIHDAYAGFFVHDPKRRHIHKASVRDRLLHHAVYRKLYPFFDNTFIYDSYSCRKNKGTHAAMNRFQSIFRMVSRNNSCICWVLKCDIRKFFENIEHKKLLSILDQYIPDKNIMWLLENIVDSYHSGNCKGFGLPLGNLTSQLFANVYMNVFDQWIKHIVKAKQYIRYADDFVVLSSNRNYLYSLIQPISEFLREELSLELHPNKVCMQTFTSGVDFLGWTHFSGHKTLCTKTKKRMFRKLQSRSKENVFQSYLGLLSHGNAQKVENDLRNMYWLLSDEKL